MTNSLFLATFLGHAGKPVEPPETTQRRKVANVAMFFFVAILRGNVITVFFGQIPPLSGGVHSVHG